MQSVKFDSKGQHITLRNVGSNMLHCGWGQGTWFELACGTSYECDQETYQLDYRTQTGRTVLVVNWIPST